MGGCEINVTLSRDHVILWRGSSTLWCNRTDGRLTAGKEFHRDSTLEYTDLGKVWGVVGKICFFTDGEWKLVVVTHASYVDMLPHGGNVYCVEKIGIIPLSLTNAEVIGMELSDSPLEQSLSAPALPRPRSSSEKDKQRELRDREKVEKRLTDALLAMFNDSHSFYFCLDSDLTQSLQRKIAVSPEKLRLPLWQQMDDRFFWNKWMLSELVDKDLNDLELSSQWVFPLLQGYVEVRQVPVLSEDTPEVLQADWSVLYQEARQRLLKEVQNERRRSQRRKGRQDTGGEIELQNMASVVTQERIIPLKELGPSSGSEYEMYDASSASEDESPTTFSPLKFTDKREGDVTGGVAGGVPAGQDTEQSQNDPEWSLISLSPVRLTEETRDVSTGEHVGLTEETRDFSTREHGSKDPEQPTHCEPMTSEQPTLCEPEQPTHSEPMTSGPVRPGKNETEKNEYNEAGTEEQAQATPTSNSSETERAQTSSTSGCSETGTEELTQTTPTSGSSETSTSTGTKEEDQTTPTSGCSEDSAQAQFYAVEDSPDFEGGVMIEFCNQKGGAEACSEGGEANEEKSIADSVKTEKQGHSPSVHESPADLEESVAMGNPFLETKGTEKKVPSFTLAIISRRSRHRAGTRYKRRGVDSEGNVANYVETELVLKCGSHVVSYVIIRGSVPVYWSQPGNKYRPLPVIESSDEETQVAFRKHFHRELENFKELVAVNLVKQTGREKLVGDAFEKHVVLLDSPKLSYVVFDFHQSTKGNSSQALQKFLDETAEFVRKLKFCWIDTAQSCGALCSQEGAFRVNCMDCLDRTNVVESILSREVLQSALQKLGVIPFEETLGGATLISYQEMWANNGDIISKQYAGTAAMKGDITRYGERKFTGLMKDGYNSAHRYYLNVFRDSYRQVLIDLMQGINPFEAFSSLPRSMQGIDELEDFGELSLPAPLSVPSTAWTLEKEEAMAEMLKLCREELFPNLVPTEERDTAPLFPSGLDGWVLTEPPGYSFLGDNKEEEPCILMYCKNKSQLSVAKLNMDAKKITCFLRIPMFQIEKILIGPLGTVIKSKRVHMRIHYSLIHDTSFYFTLTTAHSISLEEDKAILVSIAEVLASMQPSIIIQEQKITKKKSPPHKGVVYLELPDTFSSPPTFSLGGVGLKQNRSAPVVATSSVPEDEGASLSVPNSPKLKSPLHQKLSLSCDNLLSEGDDAPKSSPFSPSHAPQPAITITTPNRGQGEVVVNPYHGLQESDDESVSGSESEFEMGRGLTNFVNPMMNVLEGERLRESEEEGGGAEGEKRGDETSGGGVAATKLKFSRFKDKFRNPFSRSRSPQREDVDQNSPSPLPTDEGTAGLGTSPTSEEQQGLQSKMAAARQRFRVNSTNMWNRMRKSSPSSVPSEEDLAHSQAKKASKTRIIYIS